jgi:hypothetical protein
VSLPLYFDHNVNRLIIAGLRRLGVDVLTAEEDGTATYADERLLERATELGRVLVSNDKDLLVIARRWQREGRFFPGLVRTRQRNISVGVMIEHLALIAEAMAPHEMANQIQYVPFPPTR